MTALHAFSVATILAIPAGTFAGLAVNENSTWPITRAVQTFGRTDGSVTSERDVRFTRNLAQTFQVGTSFQIDKIFIDYEEGIANKEFTIRLFSVANVNAADPLIDPDNAGFSGTVFFSLPHSTTAAIVTSDGANNPLGVLEFDLTGADEITLASNTGTEGYAFQLVRSGAGSTLDDTLERSFKWHYNNNGNLYAGGRGYAITGAGIDGADDFLLAISAVPEPNTIALFIVGGLAFLKLRRRS